MCVPLRSYGKGTGIVIPITHTQLWEREGNRNSSKKKLRIASESEKMFARILDEFFRWFDLPKIRVFRGQTDQNFKNFQDVPALVITQNFAHQRDILEPFDCFPHLCSLANCVVQNAS